MMKSFGGLIATLAALATAGALAQQKTVEQVLPLVKQYCGSCHIAAARYLDHLIGRFYGANPGASATR